MDSEVAALVGQSQLPRMSQVLRALKREEVGLFNCCASCLDDAQFVDQLVCLYGLPAFANLRCGLWYMESPTSTCYFKSTDGHQNNWSFSLVRLNLNVAEHAACSQGCVIVDATRRGKTFPDALTKTVPIWAAVLNRAVAQLRRQQAAASKSSSSGGREGSSDSSSRVCSSGSCWDEGVHLPPWISDNEKHQIELRLEGWVAQLLEVGADLAPLLRMLRKPLRCIWLSQESRIWTDEVADTSQLDFTPVILVSASLPNARERRQLSVAAGDGQPAVHVVYEYIPGAGDDEESWAQGLNPGLLWRHKRELLAAGRDGIEARLRELLAGERPGQQEGLAGGIQAGGGGGGWGGNSGRGGCREQQASQLVAAPGMKSVGKRRATPGATNEQHLLAPIGCRPPMTVAGDASSVGNHSSGCCGGAGELHFLGPTGLAVGALGAGAPPGMWDHVDAVLNVGLWEHSGMTAEQGGEGTRERESAGSTAQQPAAPEGATVAPAAASAAAAVAPCLAGAQQQETQQQLAAGEGRAAKAGDVLGADVGGAVAGRDPGGHGGLVPGPLPRYRWLPVPHHKFERQALLKALPAALEFVSAHLQAGRRVLIHCDDGLDTSVCTALAVLLACFRLPEQQQGIVTGGSIPGREAEGRVPEGTTVLASPSSEAGHRAPPQLVQPYTIDPATGTTLPAAVLFNKLVVRRYLAVLSGYYPQARPTRGMLRQVFNLFVPGIGRA